MPKNVFLIQRVLAGHEVTVKAIYIERLSIYSVTVKVDGELWDVRHSDDVLPDVGNILEEAYADLS